MSLRLSHFLNQNRLTYIVCALIWKRLWPTGAIFGALQDVLGSRSVSRDYYNQTGRIPDWCCLSSPPPESLYDAGKTPPPLMKRAFSTEK